ncbi:hypothetical protein INT48_008130, partial [Thamnidium elegans]
MEKYSRWRDAGTGIQPFLPPVPPRTDSSILVTLSNVIHIVVGPIQAIIKIILISIVIIDNGSGMCKAGFAGDDAPRA